jgi:hypothetical protein
MGYATSANLGYVPIRHEPVRKQAAHTSCVVQRDCGHELGRFPDGCAEAAPQHVSDPGRGRILELHLQHCVRELKQGPGRSERGLIRDPPPRPNDLVEEL